MLDVAPGNSTAVDVAIAAGRSSGWIVVGGSARLCSCLARYCPELLIGGAVAVTGVVALWSLAYLLLFCPGVAWA